MESLLLYLLLGYLIGSISPGYFLGRIVKGIDIRKFGNHNPGATNTAMRRIAYPAESPAINPYPEQIMPPYLYLFGPDSKGVTGQSFDAQHK